MYNNMRDSFLNTIIICKAEVNQLPQLKRFFKTNGFRPQAAKSDAVYMARQNQSILGALRLCCYNNSWLLRSMCVLEDYRHKGIGRFMLSSIAAELKDRQCYCFPHHYLESFYSKAGFSLIDPEQTEPIILGLFNNYVAKGRKIILMQYWKYET